MRKSVWGYFFPETDPWREHTRFSANRKLEFILNADLSNWL